MIVCLGPESAGPCSGSASIIQQKNRICLSENTLSASLLLYFFHFFGIMVEIDSFTPGNTSRRTL